MRLAAPKYTLATFINEDGEEEETMTAWVFRQPCRELHIYRSYLPPEGYVDEGKRLLHQDYL